MTVDPLLLKYGSSKRGHAHFAPSAAAGWLNCPGYLLANAKMPDTAGEDAAYGTVAHSMAQRWQQTGERPTASLGVTHKIGEFKITVDNEMLGYVGEYVDWCEEVPGDAYVEQHLDLSRFFPIPTSGTADHFCCAPGLLTITDLKMGTGVHVPVENNPQAMLYALGAFEEWDWVYGFQTIVLRICQPRLGYFGVWQCTREELIEFSEYVRGRALLAWAEDAPRVPSEKACRWCAAKTRCPALSMQLDALADDSFDGEDATPYQAGEMAAHEAVALIEGAPVPSSPLELSTAFLAYRLGFRRLYEKWFNTIYAELLRRAELGEPVPGWKVVSGRRSFHWRDSDEAVAAMIEAGMTDDQVYVTEVISTANCRKALKKLGMKNKQIEAVLSELVTVVPGQPALAPGVDGREDAQAAIDDMLDTEEAE